MVNSNYESKSYYRLIEVAIGKKWVEDLAEACGGR